ncbi:unnamed protein product [Darwinula stevensoni]|uniref:Uncharacterized protein n=1 Tax=Darwinula stevensoni TaxID=69355 RepID=A0A7R9AB33_9CRUS|nr:unnamed protein product [Darwinula stevensoni]CAG0899033.1 unnamed protein product [Darwinula stevensoni]
MEEAPDGVLAVFHAIAEQDPDVLIHQFGNGTSPGLCNAFGVSAAGYAAAIGKLSPALLRFLGPNVKDINSGSPAPLIFAAFGGHAHVVRFLLMHGADPNLPCPRSGVTPLMVAALLGHEAVVDLLLEWGADTNVLSSRGDTALSLAAGSPFLSSPPIIKKLHPLTSRRPKRCETGSESSGDSMVETVTKGKSWEFLGGSGMKHEDSPLLHASMNGNLEAVALLISKGASLDDPEPQFGWTPLMQALFHRKWEVAKYLIEAGADVAYKTKDGMTAFDVALLVDIGLNDQELFQLLCQRVAASTTSSLKLTSSPSASAIALNKENLESTSFWRKLFIMPWKSQNRERKESDVKQKRQNGVLSISHENLGLSKCSLSEDSAAGKGDRRASLPEMVVNAQNCSKEVSWMALLKKYGLQDAERLLKEHEVDEYAFLVLTREDFLEIGIPQAQVSALLQVQQQLLHNSFLWAHSPAGEDVKILEKGFVVPEYMANLVVPESTEKTKGWRWFGASLSSAAAGMISSSAGKKPQEESDWQQVKLQADELYDSHNFHTLYTLLLPYKGLRSLIKLSPDNIFGMHDILLLTETFLTKPMDIDSYYSFHSLARPTASREDPQLTMAEELLKEGKLDMAYELLRQATLNAAPRITKKGRIAKEWFDQECYMLKHEVLMRHQEVIWDQGNCPEYAESHRR